MLVRLCLYNLWYWRVPTMKKKLASGRMAVDIFWKNNAFSSAEFLQEYSRNPNGYIINIIRNLNLNLEKNQVGNKG